MLTRREFLHASAVATTSLKLSTTSFSQPLANPISISSGNGIRCVDRAVELMRNGTDTLEAAVEGVVIIEQDEKDMSVGYGGLPNELGVVELDACVMHGPTMRAGAVASLQGIRTPSRVAKLVMERTDHVLLVGAGALQFAKQMGFKEEELLTDAARKAWLRWKTTLSKSDDWLDDEEISRDFGGEVPAHISDKRPTGTVTCLALNEQGEISGCTSTSGLAYKLPGRVGDSPIIGAGLYVDGEVGAAGSTGRGEANILVSGGRLVVEFMKKGATPTEACLEALRRVAIATKSPRLLKPNGRPDFDLNFYALRKDGAHGAAKMYKGGRYAVNDGEHSRLMEQAYLFES